MPGPMARLLLAGVLAMVAVPITARAEAGAPAAEATGKPQPTRQEPRIKATQGHAAYLNAIQDKVAKRQWQAVLDQASALPPDLNAYERAFAYNAAGLAGANLGRPDVAERFFRLAVDANGLDNAIHFDLLANIAILQHQQGKHEDVLATLDRLRDEAGSVKPDLLALRADSLGSLGRLAEAVAVYEQLATQQPGNKTWLINAAALTQAQGDEAGTLRLLDRAWRSGLLTEAGEYRNLYVLLAKPETLAQAVFVADEAWSKNLLARNDATSSDYQALAQIAYDLRDGALAARLYRRADEAASHGEAALNLARVLYNAGDREGARQAASRALEKGVSDPSAAHTILQPR